MPEPLFSDGLLSNATDNRLRQMYAAAEEIPPERALGVSVDELTAELVEGFSIEPIAIEDDGIEVGNSEKKVDVSRDWNRIISDRRQPLYLPGTAVTYYIPFRGEANLFKFRPSTFHPGGGPVARVRNTTIEISYEGVSPTPEQVRSGLEGALGRLRLWISFVNADVDEFNRKLPEHARGAVEQRITKVRADQDIVAALGRPVRRRENAPTTYVAPSIRRKPDIRTSGRATKAARPEPTMAVDDYEHILTVIRGMVDVMERSPSAFAHMGEEHLRDHFLVQLNGQYEGGATGETFNFEGKTDILVKVDGRVVFIAECKFWDGPQVLTDTIDQLLSYSSWRDTKVAILLFNRGRRLSTVLEKVGPTAKDHPNFVRQIGYDYETAFRFVFKHRDDRDRHLTLTVLVFELPS